MEMRRESLAETEKIASATAKNQTWSSQWNPQHHVSAVMVTSKHVAMKLRLHPTYLSHSSG